MRYNTDGTDGFSFVTLVELESNEAIYFTEQGWSGSDWQSNTETHYRYNAPSSGLAQGSVVHVEETTTDTMTVTGGGSMTLVSGSGFSIYAGDQILAYTSSSGAAPSSPNFIAGIHGDYNWAPGKYDPTTTWNQTDPTAVSDSALPTGLINGATAISLFPNPAHRETTDSDYNSTADDSTLVSASYYGERDNACYKSTAPTSGSRTELLYALNNPANWDSDNANPYGTGDTISSLTVSDDASTGVKPIGSPRTSLRPGDRTLESFTVPAGSDRLLLVAAANSGSTDITTVTFGGTAMTQVGEREDGTAVDSIWVLPLGTSASSTSGNVVVTHAASGDVQFIHAIAFSGAAQSSSTSSLQTAQATSTTASSLSVTSTSGDMVFEVFDVYRGSAPAVLTPGSARTLTGLSPIPLSSGYGIFTTGFKPGASSVAMDWTHNGSAHLHLALNIKQASGNATPTDIALSSSAVNQSGGTNASVGTLSTTDSDSGDSHTYTLVSGTGATHNGSFNISGSTLRANDASALAAGDYAVRIQTDDGNSSGTYAEAFTITVSDDVAPAAPSTPDLASSSDAGTSNSDNITTGTTPTITGTAEAGATVKLYDTDGTTQIGSGTATGGNWSIVTSTLSEGEHTITAKATDAANNTSVASSGLTITLDNTGPVITSSTSPSFTYGTAADYTLTASGSPVTFTAPVGLPAGLSMNASTGVFSGTPSTIATSNHVVQVGDTAGNSTGALLTITVNAAPLTVTGLTGDAKTYDKTTTGSASGTAVLAGIVGSDDVSLGGSPVYTFASAGVGTGITLNTTGFTLSGTDASKYTLTQPTLSANITAKPLTVTGVTGVNKAYDSTTTGALNTSGHALVGVESGDTVTLDAAGGTGTFADEHVNTGITVTASGLALAGADAANYTLTQPTGLTAAISAIPLTITGVTASGKVYDGNTTATLVNTSAALSGTIGGDDIALGSGSATATFASANIGTGITVTPTGYALSGTDAGNYTLAQPTGLTADITAKGLTITGISASGKTYDATTAAALNTASATVVGKVGSDDVSADFGSATGTFADKTIGTAKAVTVANVSLSGTAAGNYTISQPTGLTADITAAPLTITGATATGKVYDATTAATLGGTPSLVGIQGSDTVNLATASIAGSFATKSIGTAKAVTAHGYAISGADAGNYTVAQPTGLTADITAAPLTITGVTAAGKTYDATTAATLGGAPTLVGIQGSDTVTVATGGIAATFADANVGTGKVVTATGYALASTDAGNYTLSQPTGLTADIAAKGLTIAGVTAAGKTYDATTTAVLNTGSGTVVGKVGSDDVTADFGSATGAFASKTIGTGKSVTVTGVTLTGTAAGNYTVAQPTGLTADITAAALTITGATAGNKVYDASTTATLGGTPTLVGIQGSDSVNLATANTAGVFADKTIGTAKAVTAHGYAISGADAGNYTVAQPTGLTADITAAPLTITGATAAGKTYDATTTATLGGTPALVGIQGSDTVNLDTAGISATFADKTVGTAKAVTATGYALSGTDAGNYTLSQPTGITADITAATLTTTGTTASNKVYDAGTTAVLDTGSAVPVGVIGSDTVTINGSSATGTFADKNVGTGKPVTVTGLALAGADAGNYILTQPTTTADITAATLTVAGTTAQHKAYDGNTTATADFGSATLGGILGTDTVTLDSSSATATFADANVGTGKTVTTANLGLAGTDAGNYTLTAPTATADITAIALTITGVTAGNKTYDATTTATLNTSGATLVGIVGSDAVTPVDGAATGTFADKNVGTGKTVTITGFSLGGAQASNYTVVQPTATASITTQAVTVTGITAADKPFDNTTDATLDLTGATLHDVIGGDDVTLNTTAALGTFDTEDKGTDKVVTITGLTLTGTDAGNYSLTSPTALAEISAKELTISGVTAASKVYDDTTLATLDTSAASLVGIETGDTVTLDSSAAAAAFDTVLIGTGKTVTTSGFALTGADAENYALVQPTTTADITAREITLTGLAARDKAYDATTTADIDESGLTLVGVQGDDDVTVDSSGATAHFADKLVGTGKSVTLAGATLTGADAGNYTLTLPTDLTADITVTNLTVIGATVTPKVYDGTTVASLDFSGASLAGIQGSDTVTLDSSGATGSYSDATAGSGITVTVTGVALAGTDAGNYTVSQPSLTGAITKALGAITFADLTQTYTGSALEPTVTTTPSGMTVSLTYNAAATAPTNAGTYTVEATIVDANYQGADDDDFVIEKANQTVTIGAVGTLTAGIATELSATASSGLTPVTFAVTSGAATLSGSTLTALSTAPITITAAQAGDANFNAASATVTITSIVKQSQTITFDALTNRQANGEAFDLQATASSELPVTFTIVSGPVMLSGNTVTMTGASGTVTVRADQAGDAVFAAAAPVTQTFEVTQAGPLIYFGTTNEGTEFAVEIPEDSTIGTLFGLITQTGQYYILTFQVNEDRSITALNLQILGDPVTAATSLATHPLRKRVGKDLPASARDLAYTFTGTIRGGVLNLAIAELGVTLSGAVEPPEGPTATIAGLYESNSLNSANGTTTSIVGTTGKVYVIAVTPGLITGGSGTVASNGSFNISTAQQATIIGNVDAPSTTVTGTILLPDGTEDDFAGLSTGTLRTDRLINLSTRAHVDATTDSGALVAGFVIGGDTSKRVLLRAIGPGLAQFGLTTALPDPQVTVYNATGEVVAEVDNWGGDDATAEAMSTIGAFPLAADSLDAVYTTELAPGAYTMRVTNNGDAGVAIAEIYDASENPNSEYQRLINISSRGRVVGGEGVLVGGFIVTGNSPKRVLVRGAGPGLGAYGVPGVLSDPKLTVYDANEQVVARNDNWETPAPVKVGQRTASAAEITAANANVGAFSFATGGTDAALIITLRPGAYTVELSSAADAAVAAGNALIEIYEIPE
ncbi:YDG domain-containing protein [Synoicihabitans lomoniglobus]|uniref:YDG domain-containing protein n=1 Tax=Synoicihabitans lomoniglobus TaxID=2909285 RepID=A0AAF0CQM1_9BACT|nr:YDG domain-containing protein [Opitutaceae bacterium LMO-M01]